LVIPTQKPSLKLTISLAPFPRARSARGTKSAKISKKKRADMIGGIGSRWVQFIGKNSGNQSR
jgi:hypothetical protein